MKRRTLRAQQRLARSPSPAGFTHPGRQPLSSSDSPPRSGAPWHFWLVVVMAAVYLGWRVVEGVVWLIQWIA